MFVECLTFSVCLRVFLKIFCILHIFLGDGAVSSSNFYFLRGEIDLICFCNFLRKILRKLCNIFSFLAVNFVFFKSVKCS